MANEPSTNAFLGFRPFTGFLGLSLERAEYLLAFLALGEGLLLIFYFGFGFTLVCANAIIFALLLAAAKQMTHQVALVAFYGMCVNCGLHFFAVTQLISHYLFYGGGVFFMVPLTYMVSAAIASFLGMLIAYSFWARARLGQFSILTAGGIKDADNQAALNATLPSTRLTTV